MKPLILFAAAALASCQTARQVTMPNGATYSDNGHLAGDTLVMMEPDGTVILRNKMNKPWQDFLQAAGAAFVSWNMARTSLAETASRTTIRTGTQAASVDRLRITSGATVEQAKIAADLEKFRLLNPSTALP